LLGALYSQVIGYSSKVYGKSQIEAAYNNYPTRKGNNLYLTIDHKLQALGGELLNGRKGAVVAMDPKTGKNLR